MYFNSGGEELSPGEWLLFGSVQAVERNAEILITRSGTLKNLQVQVDVGPTNGNPDVLTVRRNETDTALSVTISYPSTSGQDATNSVVVAPGDRIALQLKSVSGSAPTFLASFDFCPSCGPC